MFVPVFVCLSVCLYVETWTNYLTFEPDPVIVRMPEPDCFLRYRISAAMRNFTSGKSHWRHAATASRGFKMVLFTEPSEDLCRR